MEYRIYNLPINSLSLQPLNKCRLIRAVVALVFVEGEGLGVLGACEEHHLVAVLGFGDLLGFCQTL